MEPRESGGSGGALQARFDACLAELGLPDGPVLIGVSGGADSLALLDLVARSRAAEGRSLAVLHVDHGIHPESAAVAARVTAAAGRYGLEAIVVRLGLGPATSETRARTARLAAFRRALDDRGAAALLLAHHADDQVETLLMRFLRGSGPAGQAGIAVRSGRVLRPLLSFTRAELREHTRAGGLEAWDDPANVDPRHDRAWLRARLLPELEARWPDLRTNLLRAAELHGQDRRAWDQLLRELPELDFRSDRSSVSVAAPPLGGYSSALSVALLRAFSRAAGARVAGRQFDRIDRLVRRGGSGRMLDLGAGWRAELGGGRLRLYRPSPPVEPMELEGPRGEAQFGRWRLEWREEPAPARLARAEAVTWIAPGVPLAARPWRSGDRIRPLGGTGSRLVVRCMQDEKVARGDRPDWPVVEADGGVIWVPGVCRSDSRVPKPGTRAVRIDARRD